MLAKQCLAYWSQLDASNNRIPRRIRFGVIDRILWAEGGALGFLRSILVGISAAARLCGAHCPYASAHLNLENASSIPVDKLNAPAFFVHRLWKTDTGGGLAIGTNSPQSHHDLARIGRPADKL